MNPGIKRIKIAVWIGILITTFMLIAPFLPYVIWDGSYPLVIDVASNANRPITKVIVDTLTVGDKGNAKEMAQMMIRNRNEGFVEEGYSHAESTTSTIKIEIPNSGRGYCLGLLGTYSQFRWLLLEVHYADGFKENVVVDIPDGRNQRTLTVYVP